MAHEDAGMIEFDREGRASASCTKPGAEREAILGGSTDARPSSRDSAGESIASRSEQSWPVPLSPLPPPHANAIEQERAARTRAMFARLMENEATAQAMIGPVEFIPSEAHPASSDPIPLLRVLYEDDDMIAVAKPSGLYCDDVTVLLNKRLHKETAVVAPVGVAHERVPTLTLMHRLDRDTSGVMLLSKTAEATRSLSKAFSGHGARKTYVALGLCSGPPPTWTSQKIRTGKLRVHIICTFSTICVCKENHQYEGHGSHG